MTIESKLKSEMILKLLIASIAFSAVTCDVSDDVTLARVIHELKVRQGTLKGEVSLYS